MNIINRFLHVNNNDIIDDEATQASQVYSHDIEKFISIALVDGKITDKERNILKKKAEEQGIDPDEFDMVLDARLAELAIEKQEQEKLLYDIQSCSPVNQSAQRMADMLLNTRFYSQKKHIIESFPIPSTKTDIIEFLTLLKGKMMDEKDPLANSYGKKYDECVLKARTLFKGDSTIEYLISDYEMSKREIQKAKRRKERRKNTRRFSLMTFVYFLLNPGIIAIIVLSITFIIIINNILDFPIEFLKLFRK